MSVIVATGALISRSCVNTSKTKQMYSFSKAERFPVNRRDPKKFPAPTIYDIPSTKMNRFTTFGYGERYDFTGQNNKKRKKKEGDDEKEAENLKKRSELVSVIRTDFDPKKPHGSCYTFGVGRDKYDKVYLESNKMIDKNVPGPGKYYKPPDFGKEAIKYSFRGNPEPKKELIKMKEEKYPQPGPGQYPVCVKITPQGKYAVSGIENVSTLKIIKPVPVERKNATEEEKKEMAKKLEEIGRFDYVDNKVPGPGAYPQKQLIQTINYNSKYRSYGPQSMHKKLNEPDYTYNNPGPGKYVMPSEFGLYQDKKAKEIDEQLKKKFDAEDEERKKEYGAKLAARKSGHS